MATWSVRLKLTVEEIQSQVESPSDPDKKSIIAIMLNKHRANMNFVIRIC